MLQPSPYRLLGWDVSLPRGVECPACSQVNQPGNIYPCKNSNSTPNHSTTILMLGMSKPLTSATIQIFPTFSSLSKPTRREFPSFFFLAYTATDSCVYSFTTCLIYHRSPNQTCHSQHCKIFVPVNLHVSINLPSSQD